MSLEDNKAVVGRMWEIANSHDGSRFGQVYADNIVYHEGGGSERRGLAEFTAYVETFSWLSLT